MQSRLATKSWRVLSAIHNQALQRRFAAASIHSVEVDAGPHSPEKKTETEAEHTRIINNSNDNETEPLVPPKPPHISSPSLETTKANQPLNPNFQQKRHNATTVSLEDVSCAGLDGTPWPEEVENEHRDKNLAVEDDREYFKHHKASPLSEMKMADTRKPITRATDAGEHRVEKDVIGWKPEQLLSAEETLLRAAEFFKQNAARGDPDVFPHSRVLRELRGEWF